MIQQDLFGSRDLPEGFRYAPELIAEDQEAALLATMQSLPPADLQHVLLTEYRPGAAIGWHKDRSVFGDVIGISLLAPCTFRMRQKVGSRWRRASMPLAPRSGYLLRGPSRTEWEHSIPEVAGLRYSVTFRNMAAIMRGPCSWLRNLDDEPLIGPQGYFLFYDFPDAVGEGRNDHLSHPK
jgi:hypothetical protein